MPLQRVWRETTEVALVDIGLPGISGIEGVRILKDRHPNMHLLRLTVYKDDDRVMELFREYRAPQQARHRLSPQEHRLPELLGEGHHHKTAAEEMGISLHTVKFYMRQIYEKLQVHSKSEAVARSLRNG